MARQRVYDPLEKQLVTCCVDQRTGRVTVHAPGRTYCRACWPPRGRGRGESLTSARRINAKLRAYEAVKMWGGFTSMPKWLGGNNCTLEHIAHTLGYKTRGGAWRAIRRTLAEVQERYLP